MLLHWPLFLLLSVSCVCVSAQQTTEQCNSRSRNGGEVAMLEEVLDTLQVINSRLQSIENRQQSMDSRLESIEKHVGPPTLGESKYYFQYEI